MLDELLLPSWATLPPAFRGARAHHVGIDPARPPLDLLGSMRTATRAGGGASRWPGVALRVPCACLPCGGSGGL